MNKDDSLVTVVIATYNMEKYLCEAVESVRSQTYSRVEIIIVDDGSTDGTGMLVNQWTDVPGIRYLWQENQGQTKAKNRGIMEARGNYIAFLDADDRWKPTKLAKQIKMFASERSVGVVYSDAVFIDEDGRETGRREISHPQGWVTKDLLEDNFVNFGSAVVSKDALQRCGIFDETLSMSIDYDLWLRISTVYEFRYVDEPLFEYRIWGGQMSHRMLERTDCVLRILDKFEMSHGFNTDTEALTRARSSTYVSRGYARRSAGGGRIAAIYEMMNALWLDAKNLGAWKGVVKVILGRSA